MEGLPILEASVLFPHSVFALHTLLTLFSCGTLRPFWKRDFPWYEYILHIQEDWRNTCAFSHEMGKVYISSSWLISNALYCAILYFVVPQAYLLKLFTISVCIPLILIGLYQHFFYLFIALGLLVFVIGFFIATIITLYAFTVIILSLCFGIILGLKIIFSISV